MLFGSGLSIIDRLCVAINLTPSLVYHTQELMGEYLLVFFYCFLRMEGNCDIFSADFVNIVIHCLPETYLQTGTTKEG